MPNNFNFIAPFYDLLSRTIYGNKILNAKKQFIGRLHAGQSILILGGGTGNILNTILDQASSLQIDFVEPSKNMIKRAEKNLMSKYAQQVHFILGDENVLPQNKMYDAVFTFFVFDLFTQQDAELFGEKTGQHLKPGGMWLFADFFPPQKTSHKVLLRFMYLFFKVTTRISSSQLPEYNVIFEKLGCVLTEEVIFMNGFIRSRIYQKSA